MLKLKKSAFFLLLTLVFALPVFAQKRTVRPLTGPTPTAKERQQRLADEAAVRNMQDPGYDLAVVVKPSAIRETAAPNGKILLSVKRNTFLSLVDREIDRNWYNVVDADSGTEGWIHANDVVIKLTTNTQTGPPLEEEKAAANAPPEVIISNLEEKTTLRIRLNRKLYLIAPGETKTVPVAVGKFTYYGWSPGIKPATGSRMVERGKKYVWKFRIFRR